MHVISDIIVKSRIRLSLHHNRRLHADVMIQRELVASVINPANVIRGTRVEWNVMTHVNVAPKVETDSAVA